MTTVDVDPTTHLIPSWAVPLGELIFTAESIVGFARLYDPYPFHLSEEAGKKSILGGLAASGWQSVAAAVPLVIRRILGHHNILKSMGARDIRWPRPVLKDDTLTAEAMIVGWNPQAQHICAEVEVNYRNQRGEDTGGVTLIFALHPQSQLAERA